MEVVEVGRRIKAGARDAWELVGDFAGSELTRGYVARVERRGHGVGSLRLYHLEPHVGTGVVTEMLEEQDDTRMILRYSMPDNGSLPWTQYSGCIRVQAAGDDCVVLLRTQFIPIDFDGESLREMSRKNINDYFDNLVNALTKGRKDHE